MQYSKTLGFFRAFSILNSKIADLDSTSGATGSALLFRAPDGNLAYGCWETGLYSYPGYYTGGPSDWSGLMLVAPRDSTDTRLKIAFSTDGHIYTMRQESDGSISQNWTQV